MLKRQAQKAELLGRVPIFQDLSKSDLTTVARYTQQVMQPAGAVLARQGTQGREFSLIVDGRVRVEVDGRVVARLGPGDFFGEISLIDGKPRTASVIADTPLDLLVIRWSMFLPLLEHVKTLPRKLLVALCERLREADSALAARN
jgi:CRP/FNR family transcriptional regulator, cyclic AMP receptor protein